MSMHVAYNEYSGPILRNGQMPVLYKDWIDTIPLEVQRAYIKYVERLVLENRGQMPRKFDIWRSTIYPVRPAISNAETLRDNQQFGHRPRRKNQIRK